MKERKCVCACERARVIESEGELSVCVCEIDSACVLKGAGVWMELSSV